MSPSSGEQQINSGHVEQAPAPTTRAIAGERCLRISLQLTGDPARRVARYDSALVVGGAEDTVQDSAVESQSTQPHGKGGVL
jgi:hypothetical protein